MHNESSERREFPDITPVSDEEERKREEEKKKVPLTIIEKDLENIYEEEEQDKRHREEIERKKHPLN
jgi:hypothetical protein